MKEHMTKEEYERESDKWLKENADPAPEPPAVMLPIRYNVQSKFVDSNAVTWEFQADPNGQWIEAASALQREAELTAQLTNAYETAAKICDNYGREGDRLAKEYACEVADEIAARIRNLKATPSASPCAILNRGE
jgi:hypothetical protein